MMCARSRRPSCTGPRLPVKSTDTLAAALVSAGCARPPAVLLDLLAAAAQRREALTSAGTPDRHSIETALTELDLTAPRVLGPLVVEMPALDGGYREISTFVRDLLGAALQAL